MILHNTIFSRVNRLAAVLAAALGLCVTSYGQGEKIQFSEPSTPMISASNLTATVAPGVNRLNPAPNAFRQVQEDLFRPLANSFHPADSMDGGVMPFSAPQVPHAPTKRERELRDQRKNWAFTDLNELYPEQNADTALKSGQESLESGGKSKTSVSLIEKYFDKLGQKGTNRLSALEAAEMNAANLYSGSLTNGAMSKPFDYENSAAKRLFTPGGRSDDDTKDSSVSILPPDPFANSIIPGQAEAQQRRTAEFRKLLDHNQPQAAINPGGLVNAANSDPYGLHSALLDRVAIPQPAVVSAEPHRSSIDPILGAIDPTTTALHNHVFDDPTAYVLGQPNPKLPPPAPPVDPIKATQRMLDPFKASAAKPKF